MTDGSDNWSLYIIEASDRSLYTGVTTDIQPVRVVYREYGHTRSSACRREAEIKKLSRDDKLRLIAAQRENQEHA